MITRREFVNQCAICFTALAFPEFISSVLRPDNLLKGQVESFPAKFYTILDDLTTKCLLCPNGCVRTPNSRGKCNARENRDGKYYSIVYNSPCLIHLDRIEKLPLFHMLPGSNIFSIATAGCNLTCKYCQNWQFSQKSPYETQNFKITPPEIIKKAKESGCNTIAFFYTEPVVYFEYMWDIAALAKKEKMKTIMVSAGYINEKPLLAVAPYIDAITFGLKGFSEKFYNEIIGGQLEFVLKTLTLLKKTGIWFEIVNLIVPTLNDNMEDIKKMCEWIKSNLSEEVPVHFTRYVPEFQLRNLPVTPQSALEKARNQALSLGLLYAYTGNMPGHVGNNTYCPKCKKLLVQRIGVRMINNHIVKGKCPECGFQQAGLWI